MKESIVAQTEANYSARYAYYIRCYLLMLFMIYTITFFVISSVRFVSTQALLSVMQEGGHAIHSRTALYLYMYQNKYQSLNTDWLQWDTNIKGKITSSMAERIECSEDGRGSNPGLNIGMGCFPPGAPFEVYDPSPHYSFELF